VSAPAAAAPSGVVTFLFTDVEGSTSRWEADAQAMRAALVAHDKVLRTAIEAYDGFLFSHTGDGFVAAFASPMSAVNAAIDAQRELQLPVRMGLATGEAELRDGDYFGTVLNRAARVMAAGHGGQILLTESTAGLLSGVDLVDLGPRRLRDLPTPVGVFQVRAAGLRTEFPALRALDTTPGNLRPATTSLIGRESEVDAINRPEDYTEMAQLAIEQGSYHGGGIHAANLADLGYSDRLFVSDDGECFQCLQRQSDWRLQALGEGHDDVVVLGLGGHAIAACDLPDFHAAVAGSVVGSEFVDDAGKARFDGVAVVLLEGLLLFFGEIVGGELLAIEKGGPGLGIARIRCGEFVGFFRAQLAEHSVAQQSHKLVESDRFLGGVDDGFDFGFKAHG